MKVDKCTVIDLFCGAGGLTHGFICEGFHVAAGVDADDSVEYAYVHNNNVQFINKRIEDITSNELAALYPPGHVKVLVGSAPCQPFSTNNHTKHDRNNWNLLFYFAELIDKISPEIVAMENVPPLATYKNGLVFNKFINTLETNDYYISWEHVYAPNYGVPQKRKRLILIASKWGEVKFLRPSRQHDNYRTVRDAIGSLKPIANGECDPNDPFHKAAGLAEINVRRIRASKPGGTWLDWPDELILPRFRKIRDLNYRDVYGRMSWDEPAPTITTRSYGIGNGRYGHPEQDRAISLREAALLQTFPPYYEFLPPNGRIPFSKTCKMIGNAVPVALARMIAKSIRLHIYSHRGWLHSTIKKS